MRPGFIGRVVIKAAINPVQPVHGIKLSVNGFIIYQRQHVPRIGSPAPAIAARGLVRPDARPTIRSPVAKPKTISRWLVDSIQNGNIARPIHQAGI